MLMSLSAVITVSEYMSFLITKYEEELHLYKYYIHTISMRAILLYFTHGDYPYKLLNHFIPLVTHLLILILIDLDVFTKNLALNWKNEWLVSFMSPCHSYP